MHNQFNTYKRLRIFERSKLTVDGEYFTNKHWEALLILNEVNGGRYFNVGYNYLQWGSYVGIIQVQDLTLEILPKLDQLYTSASSEDSSWQALLLDMLVICNKISLHLLGKTFQHKVQHRDLLYIYLELFLIELEELWKSGWSKLYQSEDSNTSSWKGQWKIAQHLNKNLCHKSRVYTRKVDYSIDHSVHLVLREAMKVALYHSSSLEHRQRFIRLLKSLPQENTSMIQVVIDWKQIFGLLQTRKLRSYQSSVDLAQMILQNKSPNFSAGGYTSLGILFDMNRLFEEYIYMLLNSKSRYFGYTVEWQPQVIFWGTKQLRPDILIKRGTKCWVIDTKWKIPKGGIPTDNDLRQIYTYTEAFNAEQGVLLYPRATSHTNKTHTFLNKKISREEKKGSVYFFDPFANKNSPSVPDEIE
ncbi:MAG: McrC family protein, partial [Saprospiraceae bacterium]|nr:McrC family protein [Saprospiraceae bacterium]